MNRIVIASIAGFMAVIVAPARSQAPATWRDPSPHAVRFVTVGDGVQLEMLDWGGTRQPVVLLAGGGNTAHVYDEFAPKLAADHHVYGITRRGFGASGFAKSDNTFDRLRDDVLDVIAALKLRRPVLVGHSIAGAELSAVAASHPDQIAGLVYLEAAYPYAFQSANGPSMRDFQISRPTTQRPTQGPTDADLASFDSLAKWDAEQCGCRKPEAELRQTWDSDSTGRPRKERDSPGAQAFMTIINSTTKFSKIPVAVLAIVARAHAPDKSITKGATPVAREGASDHDTALDAVRERQARAFEAGVPTARVVWLTGAHHIFLSNESDVLREVRAFLATSQ